MNNFRYAINIDNRTVFTAKPLDLRMIRPLVLLVNANAINAENYTVYLNDKENSEFEKTGALIETSEEELYSIVENPEFYLSVVVEDNTNNIIGFVNAQLEDIGNFGAFILDLQYKNGFEYKKDEWINDIDSGKMAYKGDIVVDRKSQRYPIFFVLLSIIAQKLLKIGKAKCVTHVFEITGYQYLNKSKEINIYNKRSFDAQVYGAGASYVADGFKRTIHKNELMIEYYPRYIEYDILKTLKLCNRFLKASGISVECEHE